MTSLHRWDLKRACVQGIAVEMDACLVPFSDLSRIVFRPSGHEMTAALSQYAIPSFAIPARHFDMISDWLTSERHIVMSCRIRQCKGTGGADAHSRC